MNVLLIGGTRFVGMHIADALQHGGDTVTLFNRGVTAPGVHADLEQIHGDRARDLHLLDGRTWDAVVDTCGYTPDVVEHSCRYFAKRTARYLFISTISVYDETKTAGPDEDAPLQALPRGASKTTMVPETYGALKVLCEELVRSTFRHRAVILRPGLVAGPGDPTDRFTYWPVRIAAGGKFIAPDTPKEPVQYVDARDLAAFAVHALQRGDSGTYNCVTPAGSITFGDLISACMRASASGARPVWASAPFLLENGVAPWSDLPLWIPGESESSSISKASATRAMVSGLHTRPVYETARDTLQWTWQAHKRLGNLRAGLSPERERALLQALREAGDADTVAGPGGHGTVE